MSTAHVLFTSLKQKLALAHYNESVNKGSNAYWPAAIMRVAKLLQFSHLAMFEEFRG